MVLFRLLFYHRKIYLFLFFYKTSKGRTVLSLCCKCAEQNSKLCKHSDMERAFTSCYTINEIEYALTLNYKILKIHECHAYFRQKFIFKKFVTILNYLRVINSNCLSGKSSLEQEDYCKILASKLNLSSNLPLTPNIIHHNSSNEMLYKLGINSLFGKLQQKCDYAKSIYVASQSELEDVFLKNEPNIQNIFCINNSICRVVVKPNELEIPSKHDTNCYIGSQLVSYAREELHKHLQALTLINAKIFYFDTDSIFFSLPHNHVMPLKISHALGDFKHIINGKILNFYCLGQKNYVIRYEDNGKINEMIKVKGICLKSYFNQNVLNGTTYETFLEKFVQQIYVSKPLTQFRRTTNKPNMYPSHKSSTIKFSNLLKVSRIVLANDPYLTTLPYGYTETLPKETNEKS